MRRFIALLVTMGLMVLVTVSMAARQRLLLVAGEFWTGFIFSAVALTRNYAEKARMYYIMEDWKKCAEIYREKIFPAMPMGLNTFFDGIICLTYNGNMEEAAKQIHNFVEQETMRNGMLGVVEMAQYRKSKQEKSIRSAILFLESYSVVSSDESKNPHIYIRYHSLVELVLLALFVHSLLQKPRSVFRILFLGFFLLVIGCLCKFYDNMAPLSRVVMVDIPLRSMFQSFLGFEGGLTSSLERARVLFLKYPFHMEDVKNRSSLGLLVQVLWLELKRCHIDGMPKAKNEACHNAFLAGHVVADMLEEDKLDDGREVLDLFWMGRVQLAFHLHGFDTGNLQEANGPVSLREALDNWWGDIGGSNEMETSQAVGREL